jgi:esterase/lipase superfamily enzyme
MNEQRIEFGSMKAAATWTGYPLSIIKRAKQSGCDAFVSTRVDLQKLIRWIASAQKSASELPEGFASWGDVLNQVKSDREKIRLEKDKGAVMDIADVRRQSTEAESYYHNELTRLEREAPALLAGLDKFGVRDAVGQFLKELRQRSREKFRAVGNPK